MMMDDDDDYDDDGNDDANNGKDIMTMWLMSPPFEEELKQSIIFGLILMGF